MGFRNRSAAKELPPLAAEPITVTVEALTHGGEMIGVPREGGKKVFVRGAVPGETVKVEVAEENNNFIRAELAEVLSPSPHRIEAPCPYYSQCGGCDLQHMTLQAQREFKRVMVEQTLLRQGKIQPEKGVTILGGELPGFGYRRRIVLHLKKPKPDEVHRPIGFHAKSSHQLVDVEHCLIAHPLLNTALKSLRSLRNELHQLVHDVVLEEADGELFVVVKLWPRGTVPSDFLNHPGTILLRENFKNLTVSQREIVIFEQFGGTPAEPGTVEFPAGHFSQVNEAGNKLLQAAVVELLHGRHVTEFYAGGGNITFPLARAGKRVEAVEVDAALVAYGKKRAERFGLGHSITFYERSAEKFVRKHAMQRSVVLDPPRSGADEVVRFLDPKRHDEIVYVSCALPTLTRDLKSLQAKGYRIEEVRVLDMFAQTHHVETITRVVAG